MGVFDKLKKVLFDEDEVEVTVASDELPEKQNKKVTKTQGFKDYHQDEQVDEDVIKEVKVPVEEVKETTPPTKTKEDTFDNSEAVKKNIFPVDFVDDEPAAPVNTTNNYMSRTRRYDGYSNNVKEEPKKEEAKVQSSLQSVDANKKYRVEPIKPKVHEEKDYKRYLSEDKNKGGKKPFKVTPVISPVYGILDENYNPQEVINKADLNPSRDGRRNFGPVNYNEEKRTSLKEDLVELNSTINDMINETINNDDLDNTETTKEIEINVSVPEVTENTVETFVDIPDEEVNYVDESTNIEDAFDDTDEYNKVSELDNERLNEDNNDDVLDGYQEDDEPTISLDELIRKNNAEQSDETNENPEDENLDNTIETDLFNLINSMYKDDEEDEN